MKRILLLFLMLTTTACFAQETEKDQEHSEEVIHHDAGEEGQREEHHNFKHSIAFMLGHTHISEGRDAAGDTKWLAVPSFAIDYNYRFGEKWSVGLHNDIIIESFIVERHLSGGEEEILEREYPVASLVMIGHKFTQHLAGFAGAGAEFAKGENFFMYRFGIEAGWHLNDPSWELLVGINYDIRIDAYDIWNLNFGVAKQF
ncbi:hypothetical protein E7Z59_14175 [Robertkochia marina]|uniref:Outer membrane protein beta-barrel domain-containing protein n=1 Tax=Robertkochia marina TaxID=1227945 RepID=A0A4S3LXT8_9FLAO|nr:hypothetical protein [Robertkochia marina]THD65731.1 hypothetical protein E7Z59_14175 [Robertkochia marina]